jgi:hypothetical protein
MKYVLLKGSTHGLANRLFVLSTAIRLCKKAGAKLLVDWNDGTYGVPFWEAFSLEGCDEIIARDQDPRQLNGLRTAQSAWEGQYEATVASVYQQVSGKGEYAGVDLQEIPPLSGLKTFFKGQRQEEVMVLTGYQKHGQSLIELLKHFRLSELWRKRLVAEMEAQSEAIRNGSYVGLHVRAAAHGFFPQFQKENLVNYLRRHPSLGLFVATDLASVEAEMRELFGDRLLGINRTYAALPSEKNEVEPLALHRITDPLMLESGRLLHEALRDLWLLSRSHTMFAQPNSTFSEFACLFSSAPPWRLHLSGHATLKYRIGNFYRGFTKYRTANCSFVG